MQRLYFLLLIFFVSTRFTFGFTYYVSTTGSDSNKGNKKLPFKSIQNAASLAIAGDSILVLAGTYVDKVTFANSGTAKAPIVLLGIGKVTIKASEDVTEWTGIINIVKKTYILVKNIRLQDSYWFGFYVNLEADHVAITNCTTYNTGASGIYVANSSYVIVDSNTVQKACYQNVVAASQECITFSSVDNFIIADNEVFESGGSLNGGEGINTKQACSDGVVARNRVHDLIRLGIYCDSYALVCKNIQIYDNRVYNCQYGIAISSEQFGTTKNIKVYNNLVYKNRVDGIIVSAWDSNGYRHNIQIVNNTCVKNGADVYGAGIVVEQDAFADSVIISNNICLDNVLCSITVPDAMANLVTNNLVYPYNNMFWANEIKGSHSIVGDPLLTDTSNGNFSLTSRSPALRKGTPSNAPTTDFAGTNRNLCCVDIGAYQYSGSAIITSLEEEMEAPSSLFVYYTPETNLLTIRNPSPLPSPIEVTVLNLQGNVVLAQEKTGTLSSISIEDLPFGCYVVEARSESERVTQRVVRR